MHVVLLKFDVQRHCKPLYVYSQPAKPPGLGVLQVEGVREDMATPVLSEHDRPLPAGTHLTVEAAHTRLTQHTVELRLLRVLPTDVTDTSLLIIGYEPRLVSRHRPATLCESKVNAVTVLD